MKLKPQLKYIQDKCILAAHPGKDLAEARRKELYIGSSVVHRGGEAIVKDNIDMASDGAFDDNGVMLDYYHRGVQYRDWFDIIGLPPTLARVLNALGDQYSYYSYYGTISKLECIDDYSPLPNVIICKRKLLNDDGSDATLFDQSSVTVDKIARELGYSEPVYASDFTN